MAHQPESSTVSPVVTRPLTSEDIDAKIGLAEANLDRLLEWVGRYDSKVVTILAVDTAMLGYAATIAPPLARWSWALTAVVALAAGLLFASLLCLYAGSYPRTTAARPSLVFFGTIAKASEAEFTSEFTQRTPEAHLRDVLAQCHRNGEIIDVKFRRLKWAFGLMMASVPPWVLAIFFIARAG